MINRFSRFVLKQPLKIVIPRYCINQQPSDKSKRDDNFIYEQIKTNQAIAKNMGMNQFLMRVYSTTAMSLLGALGSSYIFMGMPFVYTHVGMSMLLGAVMTFGGFVGAQYMKPTNIVQRIEGMEIFKTINSPTRLGLYGMGVIGLGLGAAPLFMMTQAVSPTILPTALALSSAIFGGASLIAYNMPKDRMLGMGGVMMGSLLGLMGLQVIGLLTAAFTGPNALSTLLFSANNYLGIGLFSALIAYDTHVAIKMYEMKQADHLGMSVQFLLNFWNILLRLMSIFSHR
jgi:FtsH-binding integral membrane protein